MTYRHQSVLVEFRRRNFAESTMEAYIHTMEHFSPINSARRRFASITLSCPPVGSGHPTQKRSGWRRCVFLYQKWPERGGHALPEQGSALSQFVSPEEVARLLGRGRVSLS